MRGGEVRDPVGGGQGGIHSSSPQLDKPRQIERWMRTYHKTARDHMMWTFKQVLGQKVSVAASNNGLLLFICDFKLVKLL